MVELTRMSPRLRRVLQVVGPLLMLTGLGLFVAGAIVLMTGEVELGPNGRDQFKRLSLQAMLLFLSGMVLLFVGGMATKFGYLKPVSELYATEASGALTHVSGAVGSGLAGAGIGGGSVKVRCRDCGSLEPETAKFCSECGAAV